MWVARERDGALYLYEEKPEKDLTTGIWIDTFQYMGVSKEDIPTFDDVKWEDEEPVEVELIRKGK